MTLAPGVVYLVGAGPGDAGLITVRGLDRLRAADVVLHDRLVASELLDEVRLGAEVIDVSKYPGFQMYTQPEINAILVDRAQRGLKVVRLKGGDPFVFGRGGEEVAACRAAGVRCVVVPGVSSALAVPAAAGIPLTHRGVGRSFVVLTAETDPVFGEAPVPFEALAAVDTVVLLMALRRLPQITEGLMLAGKPADTPAACIESGCTDQQRVIIATLADLAERVALAEARPPAVMVIGSVVGLALTGEDDDLVDWVASVAT